ncbi:MAG: DsbE family thiol:disulfide interchange protein [Alphaproteobacteria bacterium]|nr:DsbE family thiol:disulfide interchange protein [Alphaproteobacteria bacterium]MBL6777441.1 DsbE family thiol:disulfide interchange protein [Alphaproteobacteria bacterium]
MARSLTHFLPLLLFVCFASIASVALIMTLSGERKLSELPSALIGKPVPVTELPSLSNPQAFIKIEATTATPYLVNFFASWCAPCRAEAPALAILGKQIDIIGVAYKDKPEDSRKFLADFGNPYRAIGIDNDGAAGLNWGVYGVPETYLISKDGIILKRHAGPIDGDILRDEFLPLIRSLQDRE